MTFFHVPQSSHLPPFHLAFPVDDLTSARQFYGEILGCPEGRSSDEWIDFNLFGHQIVAHKVSIEEHLEEACSDVDGHQVPVRHFGLVLPSHIWQELVQHLETQKVPFLIKPCLRFKDSPGEQHTLFIKDPSGNALEFKSMTSPDNLFAQFNK